MSTATKTRTTKQSAKPIPPLREGQRLSRDEFERRYDAMPDLKKAELLEGVVYMGSPVTLEEHGEHHANLVTWMNIYRGHTRGLRAGISSTVRMDMDNAPQPDGLMIIESSLGGQARMESGYVAGAPELVGEITASTKRKDLVVKKEVFRRNGVREFIIVNVSKREILWFHLENGEFQRIQPDADGIFRSRVFPGLWLDPDAFFRGDILAVLEVLASGLKSTEYAAFVRQLGRR